MDILTHILSGVAAGTVVAGFSSKSRRNRVCEIKSKEIQKEILGERIYSMMEAFDNKIRIAF